MNRQGVGASAVRISLMTFLGVSAAACSSEQRAVPDPLGGDETRGLVTLAAGQDTPYEIAIDSTQVYWTNYGTYGSRDGSLMAVSVGGGTPTALASSINAANGVGVDGTSVYFAGLPPNGLVTSLMKVPLNGGTTQTLATSFMNDPFAVGPGGVFGTGSERDGGDLTIVKAPLAGGATTPIVPASTLPQTASSYGIAVDAESVYWTSFRNPCAVYKAPLAGGTPMTLATVSGPCFGIAVDSTRVYFAAASGVMSVALGGGAPVTLTSLPGSGLAIDDQFVYFTSAGSDVGKVSKSGGVVTSLATGQDQADGIAVDTSSVYWVNSGGSPRTGSVMKLTPK